MTPTCPQSPTGAHVWLIPPHEADTSDISRPACEPGTCCWCGAEREFTNAPLKGTSWSYRGSGGNRDQAVRGGLTAQKGRRK
jgi:hypothetical protein